MKVSLPVQQIPPQGTLSGQRASLEIFHLKPFVQAINTNDDRLTVLEGSPTITSIEVTGTSALDGVVTFGAQNNYKTAVGLTALAGGAQAGTALSAELNEFTVVATAGDSAQLPVGVLGRKVKVKNSAAKAMAVFGQTGATVEGLAANSSVTIGPGQEITFEAISTTAWLVAEGTSIGVTQLTSVTTGVTINARKGIITTFTPSTAALSATTFTVTNNKSTGSSNIQAYITDYGGTVLTNGVPSVFVKNQTASGFDIVIVNTHATNALAISMKIGFEIKA